MTSDAGFWLGADSDTIVRGDSSLDAIMGKRVAGTRLSECLSEADRQRFELMTAESKAASSSSSVKLLQVTMLRPEAPPFEAELFIVAVRTPPRIQFLIGLMVIAGEPMEAHSEASVVATGSRPMPVATIHGWQGLRSGHSSCPSTLPSLASPSALHTVALQPLSVQSCAQHVLNALASNPHRHLKLEDTFHAALDVCVNHACGGALVFIAAARAFASVFDDSSLSRGRLRSEGSLLSCSNSCAASVCLAPALRTSDGGYMTSRLLCIHISDPQFVAAFKEFTGHSETDRRPLDHADEAARGQPKDGAFLVDTSGFRLKCATKVLGLPPPIKWDGVGTKHEAALAVTWAVPGCVALVRSDVGSVHCIVRDRAVLTVYKVLPEQY